MAEVDISMMLVDTREYQEALPHAKQALLIGKQTTGCAKESRSGLQSIEAFSQVAMGRGYDFQWRTQEGVRLLKAGLSSLRGPLYKGIGRMRKLQRHWPYVIFGLSMRSAPFMPMGRLRNSAAK